MKIAAILGFVTLWAWTALSRADERPSVSFHLLENKADNTFRASMKFENLTNEALHDWTLHFNFVRPIIQLSGAHLLQDASRNGDFYSVKSSDPARPLEPAQAVTMELLGKWFLKHETDAPSGFFISYRDKAGQKQIRKLSLQAQIHSGKRMVDVSVKKSLPGKAALPLIPLPADYEIKKGPGFRLHSKTALVVADKSPGAQEAARFLLEAINPSLSAPLKITDHDSKSPGSIRFLPLTRTPAKAEAYELTITPQHVDIKAADAAGFHYAVQSLRQLLPPSFFKTRPDPTAAVTLPALRIDDYPRYAWRGLHLDVARNFRSVAEVKRLLDLMAMHKLNQFHWHLTDDEGWRIEIKAFPQLTEIGAFRGYNWPLPPTLGSGPDKKGGFYTQDEIREVVAYAQKRQITILPEIDMPGHARAMIRSLPQLVDPSDHSVYESVQMYKDNVLSPCISASYEVVDRILQEVAALFPGPYLHVGGDEVPEGVWNPERAPQCKELMAREGLQNKQEMENYFFKKIKASVEKYGKTMAGWEEIAGKPGFADRKVLTFAWKSSQEGERLAKEGYPVILNPADHLYFDLAYSEDPNEPGYYWAGTIDTAKVYSYPASTSSNVRGIQGNLWSETIWTQEDLDYRAFPRVVALAEIAWTPRARQNWQSFSQRLEQAHLPRLQAYGVQYRVAPGLSKLSSQP